MTNSNPLVMKNVKNVIYQRIGEGDVEGAIDLLIEILQEKQDNRNYNDALFLKSNLHAAKQQYEIKGVIARQEYELIVNKTLLGLESILDRLENGVDKVPLPGFDHSKMVSPQKARLPLWTGLVFGALLISLVVYIVVDNTTVRDTPTSPLNQAIANWQAGNFEKVIGDLEIIRSEGKGEHQMLAEGRLNWLSPFASRRFFFVDDFDAPPANQRWEYFEGEPGPGEYLLLPTDESRVLQLNGHMHAVPHLEFPRQPITEVQLRFRMVSDEPAGLHINLCMDQPPPFMRTTVGFYQEGQQLSIWEEGDVSAGREGAQKEIPFGFQRGRWYQFRAMVDGAYVELFIDGKPVLAYESRRRVIPLHGFNLESLSGSVQVDQFLIVGP